MQKSFAARMALVAAFTLFTQSAIIAHADEKYAPPQYWLSRGYVRVTHPQLFGFEKPAWAPHSLKWPAQFQDAGHRVGNSMLEFQDYGDGPYYHGGCDLRVKAEEKVYAPVSGKVEAGHYGYTNNPDGSSTKFWTPWPGDGDSVYFEVAVVTDDGYRFEFHHMNENALPDTLVAKLKAGGGRVNAGELLGQTIPWPDGVYNHTHVNIYTPSGVALNPEYYYAAIPDHVAPQVQATLAVMSDKRVVSFGNGSSLTETPALIAVAVNDQLDSDTYVHPPVLAGVQFDSGEKFFWDFRERLATSDGKFPAIWSFFLQQIIAPAGTSYETSGGYGDGLSVIQIPVPSGAKGSFVVKIADDAGNTTSIHGQVSGR